MPLLDDMPDESQQMWQLSDTTSPGLLNSFYDRNRQMKDYWQNIVRQSPSPPEMGTEGNTRLFGWLLNRLGHGISNPGQMAANFAQQMYPTTDEEMMNQSLNFAPVGMLKANYRSPEQLQKLRRMMAEEQQARGIMRQVPKELYTNASRLKPYPEEALTLYPDLVQSPYQMSQFRQDRTYPVPGDKFTQYNLDPIDQMLRGSLYHGSSQLERDAISKMAREINPDKVHHALIDANEYGFTKSLHDANSISNKLGEPAGVSLSMLPTKAAEFNNVDKEYIHRIMPLYGGPPTERVVNLMSPKGRTALNDAYDVVFNQNLNLDRLGRGLQLNIEHPIRIPGAMEDMFVRQLPGTGEFNRALSDQLQSSGYRGLLYNPQRWNEYEMLMLDPKYALPLDYRKFQEYAHPAAERAKRSISLGVGMNLDTLGATPGTRKGLSQIGDLMAENKSRLGDIYQERSWTQRLSEENKQRLLEMINPQYREAVGNQLYEVQL